MTSPLPTAAWWIFAVTEPLLGVLFFAQIMYDARGFMDGLSLGSSQMTVAEQSLALMLGNVFVVLGLVAAGVMTFSSDPKASEAILYSFLVGDVGHIGIVYFTVGYQRFFDFQNWNAYLIGNAGVAAAFSVLRWVTVLGGFGPIEAPTESAPKSKKT